MSRALPRPRSTRHVVSLAFICLSQTKADGQSTLERAKLVKNCMLASADQVAIDAVAARMMGDPMSIEYSP